MQPTKEQIEAGAKALREDALRGGVLGTNPNAKRWEEMSHEFKALYLNSAEVVLRAALAVKP